METRSMCLKMRENFLHFERETMFFYFYNSLNQFNKVMVSSVNPDYEYLKLDEFGDNMLDLHFY